MYPRFTFEQVEVRPINPNILELLSPGEHHQDIHIATPLVYKKKNQIWYFCQKNIGAINLKLGMQTQLDSVNKMAVGPIWTHSYSLCVRLKNRKKNSTSKSTP